MAEKIVSISEVQREITQLPEQFEQVLEVAIVVRYGKPIMTIMPSETYKKMCETIHELQEQIEGLTETLEILQDEEMMVAIRQAEQEIAEGKIILWEEVEKELMLYLNDALE